MRLSSVDIGNKIYNRPKPEPRYQQEEFDSVVFDSLAKEHDVFIKYEGYLYDGSLRLVRLEIETKADFDYLKECIIECLEFQTGERIELECEMEWL